MNLFEQWFQSLQEFVDRRYVSKEELHHHLQPLRRAMADQQAQLDALGQQVDEVAANLAETASEVQAEIDQLASQAPPELDFSGVTAKLQALNDGISAVGDLKPTAAAAPDQPPPAPDVPAGGDQPAQPA